MATFHLFRLQFSVSKNTFMSSANMERAALGQIWEARLLKLERYFVQVQNCHSPLNTFFGKKEKIFDILFCVPLKTEIQKCTVVVKIE